jgi:hypothetical protein
MSVNIGTDRIGSECGGGRLHASYLLFGIGSGLFLCLLTPHPGSFEPGDTWTNGVRYVAHNQQNRRCHDPGLHRYDGFGMLAGFVAFFFLMPWRVRMFSTLQV